jgi:hypothetical protein
MKSAITPLEIAKVYQILLQYLIDIHKEKGFHERVMDYIELTYPYEDVVIWGVTAKIVHHMLEILFRYQLRITALRLRFLDGLWNCPVWKTTMGWL